MARSRAYPGADLEESVQAIRRVRKGLGGGVYDRAALSKVLGIAEATAIRPIAAMVHFGLLERTSKGYSISPLGRVLADPLPEESSQALREALQHPSLYAELLDHFTPEGSIPERLATILHRHYGITDSAAELAADVFFRSAKYAGVLRDDYTIVTPDTQSPVCPHGAFASKSATESIQTLMHAGASQNESVMATSCDPGSQEFYFRLASGSFARLVVPAKLTSRDIDIIRKQIELLELQLDSPED